MLCGCFAASGTRGLECVQDIMKSADYKGVLECSVQPSVQKLFLSKTHDKKTTQIWFKKKRCTVLEWPTMNPDLNPIGNLWRDLKTVGGRHTSNFKELE